ncbi:unnamed protein product [Blepharisma stoltei]|uniref:Uncharacterized protein n=1 Tax=Blepharisma stoltei TaxID=1481888 RepID=A0AAU9J7Q6_9CILI|nr:unnamed protein product [Blepharisma stoltei]
MLPAIEFYDSDPFYQISYHLYTAISLLGSSQSNFTTHSPKYQRKWEMQNYDYKPNDTSWANIKAENKKSAD